jgi:hypothetical protein
LKKNFEIKISFILYNYINKTMINIIFFKSKISL